MITELAVLIGGFKGIIEEHTGLLNLKFWERAKALMEEVFYGDSNDVQRREAVSEAVYSAFLPGHFSLIADFIGDEFLLLTKGTQERFFRECDDATLFKFLGDEQKGLVPATLLGLATADELNGESHEMVHMALSGMTEVTRRHPDFRESFQGITRIIRGHYEYFNAMPESLQKRFAGILGEKPQPQEISAPAPAPAKNAATAAPAPVKPGKPAPNGGSKSHQPRSGVFAGVLSSALENGRASTQTAPTA